MGVGQLHGTDQVFSEHLQETEEATRSQATVQIAYSLTIQAAHTSAGFFGLEAGVPGLLSYLLEEK